jgi:hypothetical protein
VAVAVGAALVWEELLGVFSLIPRGAYFGDMFGAANLAHGLALFTAAPPLEPPVTRGLAWST